MRDARGFTLLEVLIAFVIATLALGVVFEVTVQALQASTVAARYDEAVVRARSHLAMVTRGGSLMPGDWHGDDGGGFHWHVHVSSVAEGAARQIARTAVPIALYAISVRITWTEDDHTREVRLDTEHIGKPVGSG
jgi:general secretion pathway protein I